MNPNSMACGRTFASSWISLLRRDGIRVEEKEGRSARIFASGRTYDVFCTCVESDLFDIGVGHVQDGKLRRRLETLFLASGARYTQPGMMPSMFERIYRCPCDTIDRLCGPGGPGLTRDREGETTETFPSGRIHRNGASLTVSTGPALGPNAEFMCFVRLMPNFRVFISKALKSLIFDTDAWLRSAGGELVVAEGRPITE